MKTSIYARNATLFKPVSAIYYYFTDNCIVIRDDGNLNEEDCTTFLSGCPSVDYKRVANYINVRIFSMYLFRRQQA